MKLEEHSSTNLFSSGGTSFVVLLNLFVTCYSVIEHDFGAFLSLKLVEDWVQVLFFELPQESVTSLSCKLNILSLPRDILSVSKRLGNKKKKKEVDVLYSQSIPVFIFPCCCQFPNSNWTFIGCFCY